MDLQASPVAKAIFRLREIPARLRGEPFPPPGPRGIVEQTLALGWGVLAEVPDREIVIGAYTRPWHQQVTFHSLPPEEFAAFDEPGYARIAWTLGAESVGPNDSIFVTRTRVATTDPDSRRLFRLYWAPMSAGIIVIRYTGLPMVIETRSGGRADLEGRRALGLRTDVDWCPWSLVEEYHCAPA